MQLNKKLTFSIVLFIIGIILCILSVNAQNSLDPECVSSKVHIGLNIILSISIMLMILPLAQLMCFKSCGCTGDDLNYKFISLGLLVIIGITGAVIWNGIETDTGCDNSSAKSTAISITIMSFISIPILFREKILSYFKK